MYDGMCWPMCGTQMITLWHKFSPSAFMWVLGTEYRLSGFEANVSPTESSHQCQDKLFYLGSPQSLFIYS